MYRTDLKWIHDEDGGDDDGGEDFDEVWLRFRALIYEHFLTPKFSFFFFA